MLYIEMSATYWEHFYKTKPVTVNPSKFAIFVANKLNDKIKSILDLGCGNGRDSYYLQDYAKVVGVDLASEPLASFNSTFLRMSMEQVTGFYDLIYMRFSLHSISEDIEEKVFDYAKNNCKYIAIEARSTADPLSNGMKENIVKTSYANEHYRRYINKMELRNKLEKRGFKILHLTESNTYAQYKDTSPACVRVIAQIN